MQEFLLKIRYFKENYQKTLKNNFFLNPVPFNGQDYEKQQWPGTSDQQLFRLQNKFRKIPLLVTYYLNKFPFESGKSGKVGIKLQRFEYCTNEKSFLDEIKSIFMVFEGLSCGKKLKKILGLSFKELLQIFISGNYYKLELVFE